MLPSIALLLLSLTAPSASRGCPSRWNSERGTERDSHRNATKRCLPPCVAMATTTSQPPPVQSQPVDSQLRLQPLWPFTDAETAAVDGRVLASLTSLELVQSMGRIAQRLFHHIDPTASSDGSSGAGEQRSGKQQRAKGAKRKRSAAESESNLTSADPKTQHRWQLHWRDELLEEEAAQQKSAFHLPAFLHSVASPAHFHRFASQPAASTLLPRFLACISSLRDMAHTQTARLRSAPPPLLDRLSFTNNSLSSLNTQHSTVTSALKLCRDRLRDEVEEREAAANGAEHFLHVHRSLQRIRRQLRLVSSDEQEATDRATLTSRPSRSAAVNDTETETETVHIASAGVASCFVLEVKLRRKERSEKEQRLEFERRRSAAAAAGSALTPSPLHDCIVSVTADFLQGDAELHDTQIDCDLYALLADCRFAALQSKLSHALSMEAIADRFPQHALYNRKVDVMAAFNECRERSKLPCVLTSAVDGPQLAFHHFHSADEQSDTDEQLAVRPHLFFSTPSTRLCFASHPGHSFTHSLTYIGMDEMDSLNQPSTPASSASPPTFCHLLSITPSVLLPYSTLRTIARSAAGESYRGHSHSHSNQTQSPQPTLSYHDYMAHTSPSATSRFSARFSFLSTLQQYTLANDATLIEEACSVSYLSLLTLRALPGIVHTLRQHIAFNQLYASCFRQPQSSRIVAASVEESASGASAAPASAVSVEVTAFPPHTLRLRITHPSTAAQYISLDIRLAPAAPHESCTPLVVQQQQQSSSLPHSAVSCFDCHLWSVQLDRSFDSVAPCSDSFALRVLSITQSVPALVHAVVSRATQQANGSSNGH